MSEKYERFVKATGFHFHDGNPRCLRRIFSDGTVIEITNIAGTDLPKTFSEKMRLSIYMFGNLLVSFTDKSMEEFMALKLKEKEANDGTISESHKEGE